MFKAILCIAGDEVKEGDIRVIGSANLRNGYIIGPVHVFLSGVWGSIYTTITNTNTARVVCRQLGYKTIRKYS